MSISEDWADKPEKSSKDKSPFKFFLVFLVGFCTDNEGEVGLSDGLIFSKAISISCDILGTNYVTLSRLLVFKLSVKSMLLKIVLFRLLLTTDSE